MGRVVVLFSLTALATHQTRGRQSVHRADSVGAAHQGDRIAFRLGGRLVFHLFALAVLGEHRDCGDADDFRRGARVSGDPSASTARGLAQEYAAGGVDERDALDVDLGL